MYQHPNKFTTRQHELQLKKAGKEVSLDGSGSLTVRDKPQHSTCDTNGELELVQALRRRALAFDLVGVCSYETMNMYHSLLIQRIQDAPPPNYAKVSVVQAASTSCRPSCLHPDRREGAEHQGWRRWVQAPRQRFRKHLR